MDQTLRCLWIGLNFALRVTLIFYQFSKIYHGFEFRFWKGVYAAKWDLKKQLIFVLDKRKYLSF